MHSLWRDWEPILFRGSRALAGSWTGIEVLDFFCELERAHRGCLLLFFFLVALLAGVVRGRRPRSIDMVIPGTDTKLSIVVGDIFKEPGCRAIAVNEFFDSSMPDHVSPLSLHGAFLNRHYKGQEAAARSAIDDALPTDGFEYVDRPSGARRRYPIGTTARLKPENEQYFLVAVSHTDAHLQASATVTDLTIALNGLWQFARRNCNGERLALPLIGSGLARVGLPTRQLLDVIISSLVVASRKSKITEQITIVLTDEHLKRIDLRDIESTWSR